MKVAGPLSVMMLIAGLASSCTRSKGQVDILRMIIEAKTPADHEAIAEYYDRQTTEAESDAKFQEAMAERYQQIHPRAFTFEHCIKIAQYYEGVAQQDSQLAAAHRALAQQNR